MEVPQRRKKMATYGRPSRSTTSTTFNLFGDAPSPEKTRTNRPAPPEPKPKKPTKVGPAAKSKAESASLSVFDFPSSDDEKMKSPPKRAPAKLTKRVEKSLDTHAASEDSASEQLRREYAVAETKRHSAKSSESSGAKTEEKALDGINANGTVQKELRRSRVAVVIPKPPARKVEISSSKRSLPADDSEVRGAAGGSNVDERPPKSLKSRRQDSPRNDVEARISDARASNSNQTGIRKQDTNATTSQGHRKTRPVAAAGKNDPASDSTSAAKALSMVRSRRTLAKPDNIRTAVSKGKSAPAMLQQMLPSPETKPSSPADPPPSTPKPDLSEDDQSADVSFPATPPARTSNSPFGTVTPRQNQAWNKLLDFTEKSSPSVLPLGGLKIASSVKPSRSLMQRSASDMTATAGAQKRRLVDTLKQSAAQDDSSEDEEEDETMLDEDVALGSNSHSQPKATFDAFERLGSSQEAMSSQSVLAAGPKHTYSQTRSYLNDSNQDDLNIPMFEDLAPPRKSIVENDEDLEDGTGGMRNIHALRAAGTARRVVDDLEALLDDIEDPSPKAMSRRRTALLELCQKLQDRSYVTRMAEHSLDHRLFASLAKTKDAILGFGMASTIAVVILGEAPVSTLEEIYQTGCLATLASFSKMNTDINKIAKDRKTNMSRIAQGSLAEFRDAIGGIVWPEKVPAIISPSSIALKSMEMAVRKLRESGNAEDLLGYQTFADVAELAHEPSKKLASASATESDLYLLELVISTLESAATLNATAWISRSDASMNQLVDSIDALVVPKAASEELDLLARRLILNLTNNKPRSCDVFAKDSLVHSLLRSIDTRFRALSDNMDENEHVKTVAYLIVSLNVLSNLAEFSDRARAATLRGGDEILDSLTATCVLGIEKAAQADSIDGTQSGVAYAYLTVLMGNLCQNAAVREKVRAKLPGQRLGVLIRAIQEFLSINMAVDRDGAFDGEEGGEVWTAYTARLQGVIDRLKTF
ncbi:wings apart-like protein regulation of heterochromatin-domain-containing protein [Phyllosticta capitalensis]